LPDIINEYPRQEDKIKRRKLSDIKYIILHHTVSDDDPIKADVYGLFKYFSSKSNHITPGKPLPAPAYHMVMEVVENKVEFFDTAYAQDITYHVGGWNKESFSVAINQMDYAELTVEQYSTLVVKLAEVCLWLNVSPILLRGHRELKTTGWSFKNNRIRLRKTCPGFINLSVLRQEVVEQLRQMGFFRLSLYEMERYTEQYIDKTFINKIPQWERQVFGGVTINEIGE